MPLIAMLLQRRIHLAPDGIYIHRPWESFKRSDRPILEKSWGAWIQAHVALSLDDLNAAGNWLHTASGLLDSNPNELCMAEVLSYWAQLFDRMDEPRKAIQYALAAWHRWYAFASDPQSAKDLESIRALVQMLASPDELPALNDEELYFAWIADRLALQFENSAKVLISLCAMLEVVGPALEVAEQMRGWLDRISHSDPILMRLSVVSYAELLSDMANLYDQVGEKARSLEMFREAIALLEHAVDDPDVYRLHTRLRFNAGNQLAKLGEYEEARAIFEEVQKDFERQGDIEAVLRTKYVQIRSRWRMQELDGLKDDLEALLVDYETHYDACESADQRMVVRQNLDAAYRLWLTLVAAGADINERLAQRFLGQLCALREGILPFARNWATVADLDTGASMVSETDVLVSRLARLKGTVLLVLESGVDRIVLATVRSGEYSFVDRVRIELGSDVLTQALVSLLELHHTATNGLIDRAIAVESPAGEDFERVCREVWRALPEGIRRDLTESETILVSPSNAGNMDEIPVELFHDGSEYLGIMKNIMRVASLGQLHAILSNNRVNVKPYDKGLVVRAAEVAELGHLPHADSEVRRAERSMLSLTNEVIVLREPSREELLGALGDGIDVMHYVGHGFADESGEVLILGSEKDVTAIDLRSVGPARAPVCIISSCLIGRVRHLRTGKQQGITVALLDQGAPAVVAANYALPDQVGNQFVLTLYHYGRDTRLSDAMRLTRRNLATKGYHPAAWGAFVIFGHPDATLRGESRGMGVDLAWPTNLCRFMATGALAYLDAARRQLRADARLSVEQVENVEAALSAFSSGNANFFDSERHKQSIGLQAIDAEAFLAYEVLLDIGYLRFGVPGDNDDSEEQKGGLPGLLLLLERLLSDSYLLVTLAVEFTKLPTYALMTEEERSLLQSGSRALNWLNADDPLLEEARKTFAFWNERLENAVFVNIQELAGVDAKTWALADAGDRQALKLVLRNLWTQRASVAAITSTLTWTEWMLRMIGSPTDQTISDLFGVINESRKKGLLSETEAGALNRLLEQYTGPGKVDKATVRAVLDVFSDKPRERSVLNLFMIHDRLASDERKVSISKVQRAWRLAEKLGSPGAEMYFASVWCQKAAQLGALEPAVTTAWSILKKCEDLATQDSEYIDRVGGVASLLRQLCQYLDDREAIARIDARYMDAMQTYWRSRTR